MRYAIVALLGALAVLAGCASQTKPDPKKDYSRQLAPGQSALELVTDIAQYPDFRAMYDDREDAIRALRLSRGWFDKPSSKTHYPFEHFTHERVSASLDRLIEILEQSGRGEEMSGLIIRDFDVYRSVGWDGGGGVLFTGYCQPIFAGSRERTERFRYPLYGLPPDLVKDPDGTPRGRRVGGKIEPYPTRAEIDGGRLFEGQGLELVWLDSPLDVFVVHVQGSARIELESGETFYAGYAGKTDRPYSSLGGALVEDGKIAAESVSLAAIRRYFDSHPEELEGYLNRNESYVFFQEYPPGGPYGSLGLPVTPMKSLATDKSIFPRGAACAVDTTIPVFQGERLTTKPFVSLAADQDTGGAIRSAGRCDIFVGIGPEAETIAGYTKHEGRLFYLFLKESRMRETSGARP
ncbi:MAG: MltA domain-containing protein [Planctomycetota bacterium]